MNVRCYLNAVGLICAAGEGADAVRQQLRQPADTLTVTDRFSPGRPLPLGVCAQSLPAIPLPDAQWQSRNNQLALAALQQIRAEVDTAVARFGAQRVGVVLGTSTSGVAESEAPVSQWLHEGSVADDYHYSRQEMAAPAQFIAEVLGLQGPTFVVSTACSSGARALASARRLLRAGICDAVITGGVDSLCSLTVQGFSALEAVSSERCNPFSASRQGINIGEGAALFLMTREAAAVELAGVGESSDAHHISAPDPAGKGAIASMQAALADAAVAAAQIDYVNLHGTATALNDQMEALAVNTVLGNQVPASSTKPLTGHTLGAAGALEAAFCWLLMQSDSAEVLPPQLWDGNADPELADIRLVEGDCAVPVQYALSNSFAFGGNNISLILGRA